MSTSRAGLWRLIAGFAEMRPLVSISQSERDVMCENIYEKYILRSSDFLTQCKTIALFFENRIPDTCYTNFRDALFHFRRMAHTSEDTDLVRQSYAIREHTNRAKTDATIALLECSSNILRIMTAKYAGVDAIQKKLWQMRAEQNEYALHYRLGGIMLERMPPMRPSDERFLIMMKECLDFIKQKTEEYIFRQCLKAYREATAEEEFLRLMRSCCDKRAVQCDACSSQAVCRGAFRTSLEKCCAEA